jgi:hypothetical protein
LTRIAPWRQTIRPPSRAVVPLRGPLVPDRTPVAPSNPRLGAPPADGLIAAYREIAGERRERGQLIDLII